MPNEFSFITEQTLLLTSYNAKRLELYSQFLYRTWLFKANIVRHKIFICIYVVFVCYFRDLERDLNEGEVFLILGRFLPIFLPFLYSLYIKISPLAQNREKFDPTRRLFLPRLPVAGSLQFRVLLYSSSIEEIDYYYIIILILCVL